MKYFCEFVVTVFQNVDWLDSILCAQGLLIPILGFAPVCNSDSTCLFAG